MDNSLGTIQVITGKGRGKTTLGLGAALRALAAGKRAMFFGFDCEAFTKEEIEFFEELKEKHSGWNYFLSEMCLNREDYADVSADHHRQAESIFSIVKQVRDGGKYDMLILDEINPVIALGILRIDEMIQFLDTKPAYVEIVLTGDHCPLDIMTHAHEILEINRRIDIKHV